jgi:hypothetical protein
MLGSARWLMPRAVCHVAASGLRLSGEQECMRIGLDHTRPGLDMCQLWTLAWALIKARVCSVLEPWDPTVGGSDPIRGGPCDRTSQVIRPTYSCPCPSNLRQPCRCTWSLDKFGICIIYRAQERFTRLADITTHRRNENAEVVTITYFILKYRKSRIITDQRNIRVLE